MEKYNFLKNKINETSLDYADEILKLSKREILARSLETNDRWRDNYQMAVLIKNQETNEKLVRATQILAGTTIILSIATIILSCLTLWFQYLK
jgi:hypothetical protein